MSERSALTGGGKNIFISRSAFASGVVAREPSGVVRDGVILAVGVSCRCAAYLVIFHNPLGEDAASVTLSR